MQRWKSEDLKEVCPVTVTNDSQPEFVLLRLGQYNQLVQKALQVAKRQSMVCSVCELKNYFINDRSYIELHHIQHRPDILMLLCRKCHNIVTVYERYPDRDYDEESMKVIDTYKDLKQVLLNGTESTG